MPLIGTDASHYRKYLTTLGVSIIAGSLSLSGVFFQLQSDLLVEETKLATLSPIAREVILRRQALLGMATTVLPYGLVVAITLGLAMLAFGLFGWAKRQAVTDKKDDLEGQKLAFEIRKMTKEEEEEEQQRKDSEEAVGNPARQDSKVDDKEPHGHISLVPPAPSPSMHRTFEKSTNAPMSFSSAIEQRLMHLATEAFGQKFEVSSNLMIDGDASGNQTGRPRRIPIDLVVRSTSEGHGYVFEIKYVHNVQNIDRRLREAASAAQLSSTLLSATDQQNYRPVAILVFDKENLATVERFIAKKKSIVSHMPELIVIAIDRDTLFSLRPADFRAALETPPTSSDSTESE